MFSEDISIVETSLKRLYDLLLTKSKMPILRRAWGPGGQHPLVRSRSLLPRQLFQELQVKDKSARGGQPEDQRCVILVLSHFELLEL